RIPVWEYEFTWNSGGIVNFAPWISGQAQGYALMLFAENHRRTGDPLWRDRGYETLRSLQTMWDDGGVLLPDTTHGYWWEEFHPTARIWNGAAQAVLGVGNFWKATNDPEVGRMFDRGIEAMLYYTPEYDTGTWTLYSKVQGNNTIAYHNSHIAILDELYNLSGIQWFKDEADKYRTYTPPPGVS
ncbi:MAG: D-glucuronyl C5-epimerase family protein, partial [Gemmatimonadales bacterium]